MATMFIWKDGTEDSLVGNVALALEVKKAGEDVTIVVTEEALAAVTGKGYRWSQTLEDRSTRLAILKAAKTMGLPYHRGFDPRWTDPGELLLAATNAGVRIVADPVWVQLLAVDGSLPVTVQRIDTAEVLRMLRENTVIGGF